MVMTYQVSSWKKSPTPGPWRHLDNQPSLNLRASWLEAFQIAMQAIGLVIRTGSTNGRWWSSWCASDKLAGLKGSSCLHHQMHLLVPCSHQVPAGGELHFHLLKGGDAKQVVGWELNWIFRCASVNQYWWMHFLVVSTSSTGWCWYSLGIHGHMSKKSGPEIDECTRKAWDVFSKRRAQSVLFRSFDGALYNLI